MGRPLRIRFYEPNTAIHVMSKTAGGYFLLKPDYVKKHFLYLLKTLLQAFSFELISFSIMNNHFHLLLKAKDINYLSDNEILEKAQKAGIYKRLLFTKDIATLRKKLSDLSEFMKNLKERFSKWFNKTFNRYGYFWGGRYKNVIIENGESLEICKNYIEMNPVNAGIVDSPEKYKFSSCGEMGKFMEIENNENKKQKNYELKPEIKEVLEKNEIKQLENGIAFGSLEFIINFHKKFKNKIKLKKLKNYKHLTNMKRFFSFTNVRT